MTFPQFVVKIPTCSPVIKFNWAFRTVNDRHVRILVVVLALIATVVFGYFTYRDSDYISPDEAMRIIIENEFPNRCSECGRLLQILSQHRQCAALHCHIVE